MTSTPPVPDSPARRSADLAHAIDIFIDDDEPACGAQPPARPCEGPPCAP